VIGILTTVELFWRLAPDGALPFPRDLATIISMALPVSVIELPLLSCAQIDAYLTRIGGGATVLCRDRALRGCLVAVRGEGAIFLDADDAPEERRFTLAHEVGHFLMDYYLPRIEALHALGDGIRPVLDGDRPPTARERIESVLAHVPLGIHLNLMERSQDGEAEEPVLIAEERADRLALELLAPWDDVAAHLESLPHCDIRTYRASVTTLLRDDFGLPPRIAVHYAHSLQTTLRPETFRDRIGLS
jgi:hypothetical protein